MSLKINYEPQQTSYKEGGHDGVLLFQVDNGPPRMRKDKARSNPVVGLVWHVFGSDFTILMSSYTVYREEEWEIEFVSLESG